MLIIPFKHLLWTLLVPQVATGRQGSFVIYREYTTVTPNARHTCSVLAEGLVYRLCTLFCHIAGAIVQFVDSVYKARTTNLYSTGECYILSIILFLIPSVLKT